MTYEEAISRIQDRTLPDFWKASSNDILNVLSNVAVGKVEKIGLSAGGRDLFSVSYGKNEKFVSKANFNSAIGGKKPEVYCDKKARCKPVIVLLGPFHGQEVEGLVGLLNLINIMETGNDFRGLPCDNLREMGERLNLTIVPCANPDGLERFKAKTLQGMYLDDLRFWGQGTWANGDLCGWPQCKQLHPMKGEECGFLGCYFNDAGINAMHDDFFKPMSNEVQVVLDLCKRLAPDIVASLHSYELPPGLLCPVYVPKEIKLQVQEIADDYATVLKKYGLTASGFSLSDESGVVPPPFNLVSAVYHICGATSFVHECSHGLRDRQWKEYSLNDILDMQLALYEAIFKYS